MEEEEGNKIFAEKGKDGSKSNSKSECSISGEESASGMLPEGLELHLGMEMFAWGGCQVKIESRPSEIKTCLMYKLELIPPIHLQSRQK